MPMIEHLIIHAPGKGTIAMAYTKSKRGTRNNVLVSASTGDYWYRYGTENTGGTERAHSRICEDLGVYGRHPKTAKDLLMFVAAQNWPGCRVLPGGVNANGGSAPLMTERDLPGPCGDTTTAPVKALHPDCNTCHRVGELSRAYAKACDQLRRYCALAEERKHLLRSADELLGTVGVLRHRLFKYEDATSAIEKGGDA